MSTLLYCLCDNNLPDCPDCAAQARAAWLAASAQAPTAAPGQLLELAIRQDQAQLVLGILQNTQIELNAPCDPQRYESLSPLVTALQANLPRLVALLAGQPGFDLRLSLPEYDSWVWVRAASLELLQQYLEIPGSDMNQADGNGRTLLHELSYELGSQDKLRELLSRPGLRVDAPQNDGTTPLYRAGLLGNSAAFELLLARGADPNNRNNDNLWSILICAAAENKLDIAGQLLNQPTLEINAVDELGNSALHLAAERGHAHMLALLLRHPALQLNLKNAMGWTPLSKAAFAGGPEVLRLLLAQPTLQVNFVDQQRQTPLFHAVSSGNLQAVRLLLDDPRTNAAISNRPGQHTAYDMAQALGFPEMAGLFARSTADRDELDADDPYLEKGGTASPPDSQGGS